MSLEYIGLTVTVIGSMIGVLLVLFGALFFFFKTNNRVKTANAARILGIGVFLIMGSIPLSIPNHLLATSSSDGTSVSGVIIMSVFLGSPLLFMGLASYIGLNGKARQILNSAAAQEEIYYSPRQKMKVF